MLEFKEGAVKVLASDIRTMLSDVDRSLASTFRTSGLIPEVFDGSGMPAGQSQKVYQRMSDTIAHFVQGRGGLVSAITHLQVLQQKSNCAETDTGCLDPWFVGPFFTEGAAGTTVADGVPASAE